MCTIWPGLPPAARMDRATTSAQVERSPSVYPTTVGRPVVPLEAWMRRTSERGTANMPKGYWSRRSALVVKGKRERSARERQSSGCTPALSKACR